jgi:trans-aconitate 2-methyltransferase
MSIDKNLQWDPKLYQKHSDLQFKLGLMAIKRLNPSNSEKILEIGSGNGLLTIEIAKIIPKGEIVVIEISKEMMEQARENSLESGLNNIKFINLDAINIRFINEFDAVFSNSAIHWIPNLELMYKLLYNSLKANGRILIQTGLRQRNVMIDVIIKILSLKQFRPYFKEFKMPWRFLTEKENKKIIEAAKFSNISIEVYPMLYEFNSKNDLLGYLKSAAMVPFLSLLPNRLKDEFEKVFFEIYLEENNQELNFRNTRLFISAKKLS